MKKLLKILAGLVGVVVVLVAAAAILAPMLFNPNDYRGQIERIAKEYTGRDVQIAGNIRLSVFPWLGVSLGKVSVGNAPGFTQTNFASLDGADVRVKLLPLLSRRVEMDTVTVRGLKVHLARHRDGTTNWDDLLEVAGKGGGAGGSPAGGPPAVAALALGGLDLSSAEVAWDDQLAGQRVTVKNLSIRTGPLALDHPIDARVEFDVEASGPPPMTGHVSGSAKVALDLVHRVYRADGVALDATLHGSAIPGGKATVAVRGEATFDEAKRHLDVAGLKIDAKGIAAAGVSGDVNAGGRLAVDLAGRVIDVTGLAVDASLAGDALPGKKLHVSARATVRADLTAGNVTATGLAVKVPDVVLEGAKGAIEVRTDVAGNLAKRRWALARFKATGNLAGPAVANGSLVFDLGAEVGADLATQEFTAKGLELAGTLKSEQAPGGAVPFALGGNLALDGRKLELTLADFKLAAADLKASGTLRALGFAKEPTLAGTVKIAPFDLEGLLARVGKAKLLPPMAGPRALRSVSVDATFSATRQSVKLDPATVVIDGATTHGRVSIPDLTRPVVRFDLALDRLDADRYLPPPLAAGTGKGAAKPAASVPATPGTAAAAAVGLPVSELRGLDVDGRLRVGRLRVQKIELANVDLGVKAKNGLVDLHPLQARLYGGEYTGHMVLDARGAKATLSLDENVKGVHADALAKALGVRLGGLDLSGGPSSVSLAAKASGDVATQRYAFERLKLEANVAGKSFPGGRLAFGLGADVAVDLAKDHLSAQKVLLVVGDLIGKGDVVVDHLTHAPAYVAKLDVPRFNARNLLAHFGQKVRTADPKALTSASIKADVKGTPTSIDLPSLDVTVDDSRLKGSLAVRNFNPLAVSFNLDVDHIDADRYLPPGQPHQVATPGAAAAALPVDLLRYLEASGTLHVGELRVGGMRMSDVRLTAKAKDGQVSLHPLGAKLYQGTYTGDVRVDATGRAPRVSLDERLAGVQTGPLLKDVHGSALLSGTADATAKLTAVGLDADAMKRTANGDLAFSITNGSIYGIDVFGSLCALVSAASGLQSLQGGLNTQNLLLGALQLGAAAAKQKQTTGGRTDFAELRGTVQVANGIARNRDLTLRSPVVRVSGDGTMNLVTNEIDYLARPSLVASCQGQGGLNFAKLTGIELPVRLRGRLPNDVRVQPQFDKAIVQRAVTPTQSAQQPQQPQQPQQIPTKPEDLLKQRLEKMLKGKLFK